MREHGFPIAKSCQQSFILQDKRSVWPDMRAFRLLMFLATPCYLEMWSIQRIWTVNESINAHSVLISTKCTTRLIDVSVQSELGSAHTAFLQTFFFLFQTSVLSAQMRAHKRCKLLSALKLCLGKIRVKNIACFNFVLRDLFTTESKNPSLLKLPVTSGLFVSALLCSAVISTWVLLSQTSQTTFFFFLTTSFSFSTAMNESQRSSSA